MLQYLPRLILYFYEDVQVFILVKPPKASVQIYGFKIVFDRELIKAGFIPCFNSKMLIDVQSPFYEINIDEF